MTSNLSQLFLVERYCIVLYFFINWVLHHTKCTALCFTELHTEHKTRWFAAILSMLKWFAGHQIRNVGVSKLVWH